MLEVLDNDEDVRRGNGGGEGGNLNLDESGGEGNVWLRAREERLSGTTTLSGKEDVLEEGETAQTERSSDTHISISLSTSRVNEALRDSRIRLWNRDAVQMQNNVQLSLTFGTERCPRTVVQDAQRPDCHSLLRLTGGRDQYGQTGIKSRAHHDAQNIVLKPFGRITKKK